MNTPKLSPYMKKRARLRFKSTQPTATDQSEAMTTDINVVIGYMLKTGEMPSERKGIYGDFTELPTDLKGFIDTARSMGRHRNRLPKALQTLTVAELTALTPQKLAEILAPPAPPAPPEPPAGNKEGAKQ